MTSGESEPNEDIRIAMPWGYVVGRWYGNRQDRPILALHGWLDNMGTWNNLLPMLPPHLGVLCIDLPGHGLSSPLPTGIVYHAVDYVGVILRIMQEYNWTRVSILAHSMSAMLSFIFAALYPEQLDMLICIDVVRTRYHSPAEHIADYRYRYEKYLIESERLQATSGRSEPPSYTYDQLERIMYEGTQRSVELVNARHILDRNVTKSLLYPDKYYFSRDGRVKYYFEFITSPPFAAELARRIRKVPYCVIKGSESNYIDERSSEVIDILRANNPHFELHEVHGSHHVHLNNAADVAAIINPFICRHRPPRVEGWTVNDSGETAETAETAETTPETNRRRRGRRTKIISKM